MDEDPLQEFEIPVLYPQSGKAHFVKIKNQNAAANLKIASFRFFLDDFSHLSI